MFNQRLDTVLRTLEAIATMNHDGTLAKRVDRLSKKYTTGAKNNAVYSDTAKRYVTALSKAESGPALEDKVAAIVVLELARAIVNRNGGGRKHHWIPRALLARFGVYNGGPKSRIVVHEGSWTGEGWETRPVLDTEFCHGYKTAGRVIASPGATDFYSRPIETMFCGIESGYANEYNRDNGALEHLVALAVMQMVRAPSGGDFESGATINILPRIAEVLDSLGGLTARVVHGDDFVFTAGFPTRSRKLATGELVHYFPIGSDSALVFSTETNVDTLPEWIGEVFDDAVIHSAKRTGETVYGSSSAIAEL